MRVIVNQKSGLGDIKTAIYYKSPAMPLDNPDLWNSLDSNTQSLLKSTNPSAKAPAIAQEIRYDAGELGVDYRFFEYGLQYFPNPEGILPGISEGMADVLFRLPPPEPGEVGEWIGTKEFKNIGKYIVPGNAVNANFSGLKFFGSFRTSTQEVFVFPAGSGISKIELFDVDIDPRDKSKFLDHDLGNSETGYNPVISIYLGCTGEETETPRWSGNFGDGYYLPGVQKDIDRDFKLYSERFDSKVVFLAIGQRKEKDLQISYNAWLKLCDSEPLRNKPTYDVKADEKDKDPEQTGETIEGLVFDLASGSLLGNPDTRPKPILSGKLDKLKPSLLSAGQKYSLWKRYGPGEVVLYSGKTWVSLCSDNCGNIPGVSGKWVLRERTTDFYTSWFVVGCPRAKEILPGTKINVPDYQKESIFRLYPNPGYIPDDSSVEKLKADKTIDRVVMTENIDIDERRYYIFYLKWNPQEKAAGHIRGRVLSLELRPKPLYPVIRVPDIVIQREGGKYTCSWNNKLTSYTIEIPGKDIVIDSQMDASIWDAVMGSVAAGTGLSGAEAKEGFKSHLEKMKFSVEFEKEIPGETWTSDDLGESDPRPSVILDSSSGLVNDIILHEDMVDYETCKYTLIPSWDYKEITVSNSGDFDIEYPVHNVIRTENYRSGVYSRSGKVPSELKIKYKLQSGKWSDWYYAPYNGNSASWSVPGSSGGRNIVDLSKESQDLYSLQVSGVTVDMVIDIKV